MKLAEPEPTTTVRLGRRTVQIPLRKRRREAIKRLMEILEELEGKDIHIGSYDALAGIKDYFDSILVHL